MALNSIKKVLYYNIVSPPTGAWVAIKFANLIDPALATDIYAEKPWLYSPLLCSMNTVSVSKNDTIIPFTRDAFSKSIESYPDSHLFLGKWIWSGVFEDLKEDNSLLGGNFENNFADRRRYYQKSENRDTNTFKLDHIYNLEIFAPFIDLNTFDLSLGININVLPYLNSQPIRLICKSKSLNVVLFVIEFDLKEDGDETCSLESLDSFKSARSEKSYGSFTKRGPSSVTKLSTI